MSISYKDAGVDIEKGDEFVERIKAKVARTYGKRVVSGVGGFACLYDMGDRLLAAGTDGVGTKLKIAFELNRHETIGIDLVAMCVNDVLCTGATPLFFMDYLACGALELETSEAVIDGVVEGCLQSECALIGGETAEMPGFYAPGEYDIAGFAVGEVRKEDLLGGELVKAGQGLVGIASSGVHSNGLSLVRKLILKEDEELYLEALRPTRIYHKLVKEIKSSGIFISGMAHITGGGLSNIARMNPALDYKITRLPTESERPQIFNTLAKRSGLAAQDLYQTWNMGLGLVIATDRANELVEFLRAKCGEEAYLLGEITTGSGQVLVSTEQENFTL